jgi:hypothetical protein
MSGSAGAGGSRYAAMPLIFYRAPSGNPEAASDTEDR